MEERTEEQKGRIRQLVAALRSGQYEQTTGELCRIDGGDRGEPPRPKQGKFCCLGVACEVAIANGVELDRAWDVSDRVFYGNLSAGGGSAELLPYLARYWFGFDDQSNPEVLVPAKVRRQMKADHVVHTYVANYLFPATTLNDDCKLTFHQIADCFEYTYLREDWDAREQG